MAHVQFETIHPFLDGNGRIGRLLITFMLCEGGAMSEPLLYLSLFLKQHRNRYYELLQAVRIEARWDDWLEFFLEGVATTAQQAANAAREILALFRQDEERLTALGRQSPSVARVHEALQMRAIATPQSLGRNTGLTHPTVARALETLEHMNIVSEISGRQRDRVYSYTSYLAILNRDAEPLPA